MKLKDAVAMMKEKGLVGDDEIYGYGQKPSVMGGAAGAAANLVLLTVKDDVLRVFDAHIDNTWSALLISADKSLLSDLKVKNGFLGLQKKICFTFDGVQYMYIVPVGSKKIVAYFKDLAAK